MQESEIASPQDYPTRHPWTRRVFITLFLADMLLRGIAWSVYEWREAAAALKMEAVPGDSIAAFADPVPGEATRAELDGVGDCAKYGLTWLVTRADYVGHLVGIDQAWPMFSPDVAGPRTLARLRLIYADGSTRIVRSVGDSRDLLQASHRFDEKPLDFELAAVYDNAARRGFCHAVANRHPVNDAGSRLTTIELFTVRYLRPAPDVDDPRAFLRSQNGPPAKQIGRVVWRYDVRSKRGEIVRRFVVNPVFTQIARRRELHSLDSNSAKSQSR